MSVRSINPGAHLPSALMRRLPHPTHPPAGCETLRDLEVWHGKEKERAMVVDEYRVWPIGEHGPVMLVRCLDGELLRISDERHRPIPRNSRLWAAADTVAHLWRSLGTDTVRHMPHELSRVERDPFSRRPALWRSVFDGVWRFLALLWHGWEHATPLYVRKNRGISARWINGDSRAWEVWHHLRRSSLQRVCDPPPWSWWESFTVPGPHHGAISAQPVMSWTGGPSILHTLADRFSAHFALEEKAI